MARNSPHPARAKRSNRRARSCLSRPYTLNPKSFCSQGENLRLESLDADAGLDQVIRSAAMKTEGK